MVIVIYEDSDPARMPQHSVRVLAQLGNLGQYERSRVNTTSYSFIYVDVGVADVVAQRTRTFSYRILIPIDTDG